MRLDDTFDRWTVISFGPKRGNRKSVICRCTCGTVKTIDMASLTRKTSPSRSCGCLKAELTSIGSKIWNKTHGMTGTPTFISWTAMKSRCNKDAEIQTAYVANGIEVCERWASSFENFLEDMGERPEGTSLDRIDNSLGYEPSNCRWATPTVQTRNRSNTKLLEFEGITRPKSEWCEMYGIRLDTFNFRIKAGWSVEDALTTKPHKRNKSCDS